MKVAEVIHEKSTVHGGVDMMINPNPNQSTQISITADRAWNRV